MSVPEMTQEQMTKLKTFFYHTVDKDLQTRMTTIRAEYIALAVSVLNACPDSRSKSLALTHLEDSCMRAIQSLALEGEIQR